jgi:hypothetical protein
MDDPNPNADSEIDPQEAIQRTRGAEQQAGGEQMRGQENGATMDSSAANVQNKIRGGLQGTEAALHILGAGQPYPSGSY